MLPILDKPLIQYAVEEAVKSGYKSFYSLLVNTNELLKTILIKPMNWRKDLRAPVNMIF